jgi:hypothetical protein
VTIRKAKNISILSRRVPVAEVYSLISENSRTARPNETERPGVEVTPAYGWVEVVEGCVRGQHSERQQRGQTVGFLGKGTSETALAPQFKMRGLETISTTRHNGRALTVPL